MSALNAASLMERAWKPGRVFLLRDAVGTAVGKAYTPDTPLSIDLNNASVGSVISTDDRSQDGDVLLTAGIDLAGFEKNPVVLFNHDPDKPIARGEQLTKESNRLSGHTFFAQSNPFAMQVFALYAERVLRGWSIRAMPDWDRAEIMPGAAGRMPSYIFPVSRLIEYSAVTLPDNLECVTRALTKKWDGRPLDLEIVRALQPYAMVSPPWVSVPAIVSRVSTWDEDKHPRADDGKFVSGGGGGQESGQGKAGDSKPDQPSPAPSSGDVGAALNDYKSKTDVFAKLDADDVDHEALIEEEAGDAGRLMTAVEGYSESVHEQVVEAVRDEYGADFIDHDAVNPLFDDFQSDRDFYVKEFEEKLEEFRSALTAVIEDDRELGYVEDENIDAFNATADELDQAQAALKENMDKAATDFNQRLAARFEELETEVTGYIDDVTDGDDADYYNDQLEASGNPFRITFDDQSDTYTYFIPPGGAEPPH